MTVLDQVETLLANIAPEPMCDACIAKKLNLSISQHANHKTRELEKLSKYDRRMGLCTICGSTKKVICKMGSGGDLRPQPAKPSSSISKVKEDSEHPRSQYPMLKRLLDVGFKRVGIWSMEGRTVKLNQYEMQKSSPALYAFVSDEEVLYVGKTNMTLARRLYGYVKPGPSQSTNIRVNSCLYEVLTNGGAVDIYGYSSETVKQVGTFNLNMPAGLEDDIIRQARPKWNTRK
jgi:hypothetical protein